MRVLLVGNYAPDAQESMARYAQLMNVGLTEAGHEVTVVAPRAVLNRNARPATGVWKWVGYLDKYGAGVGDITRAARRADIVHVCDHSNATYVPGRSIVPYVVTCHDLLAVRGALGEDTDCPASFTGRLLQRQILRGLRRAHAVACVSEATLRDARRLLNGYAGRLLVAPNALNYPYRQLPAHLTRQRLDSIRELHGVDGYVLHVGSNLRRKNRECVLHALAAVAPAWPGRVVFAGQPLGAQLRALAARLGVTARIIEVPKPDDETLEALYNGALALLFPSRFEGFGWPIVEAQACGCPVICSDREPFPEVAAEAAILCDADDHAAFAAAITELARNAGRRGQLVQDGLTNARRYGRSAMIARFESLYERVLSCA